MTPFRITIIGLAVAAVMIVVTSFVASEILNLTSDTPFADSSDPQLVARGRVVYIVKCASCHGAHLQGELRWNTLADVPLAPPLDQSGHAWHHSDASLFAAIRDGIRSPGVGARAAMPSFQEEINEGEIAAVLAFIKNRWPLNVRGSQALLNPEFRGMPPEVADSAIFPPECVLGQSHLIQ